MTSVATNEGRVLTGIAVEQSATQIVLQLPTERVLIPRDEIEETRQSPLSMMPEGQLDRLTPDQIRNLIAYLATKEQVPLPEEQNSP